MRDWAGPEETFDPQSFERLFRGALLLETKVRRLRAATLVLAVGRLGLTVDEVVHCHEGWIDWEAGTIEIPAKEPCACAACWSTARERRDYTEPIEDVLYEECWSPPEERASRTVPFAWSPRAMAALATTYDRWEVLDLSPEEARDAIEAAARKADEVDPVAATPATLEPTAAATLQELGLDAQGTAEVLGVDARTVAPYAPDDADPTARLARLAGSAAAPGGDPAAEFPVACGTEQYPAEPFDVTPVDADALAERAAASDPRDRVPREPQLPDSVDYDPADHAAAAGPTRRDGDATPSVPVSTEPSAGQGGGSAGGLQGGVPDDVAIPDASALEDAPHAPAEADQAGGSDGTPPASPDTPAPPVGGNHPSASSDAGSTRSGAKSPRKLVTQPVVADVSTRVAADGLCGGREIPGRVVLGQEELLVLRSEADGPVDLGSTSHLRIPLDTVWDVTIDHVPRRLDASFPRTVTLAHRPEGTDQHAVAVQLPPQQRRDLASALFRILLNVTPVTLVDPARVAGRVTDNDPARRVMYVRPRRIAFTDEGGDSVACSFDLSDVIHVDRTERTVDGTTRPVVELRRVTNNEPVTTVLCAPDGRLQRLAWRFVRREYQSTLAQVRELRLSDPEKMILVGLYSTEGAPDLGTILDLDEQALDGALQSLAAKDLIRSAEAETELTGKGQLAVSDRLDSVND